MFGICFHKWMPVCDKDGEWTGYEYCPKCGKVREYGMYGFVFDVCGKEKCEIIRKIKIGEYVLWTWKELGEESDKCDW